MWQTIVYIYHLINILCHFYYNIVCIGNISQPNCL